MPLRPEMERSAGMRSRRRGRRVVVGRCVFDFLASIAISIHGLDPSEPGRTARRYPPGTGGDVENPDIDESRPEPTAGRSMGNHRSLGVECADDRPFPAARSSRPPLPGEAGVRVGMPGVITGRSLASGPPGRDASLRPSPRGEGVRGRSRPRELGLGANIAAWPTVKTSPSTSVEALLDGLLVNHGPATDKIDRQALDPVRNSAMRPR